MANFLIKWSLILLFSYWSLIGQAERLSLWKPRLRITTALSKPFTMQTRGKNSPLVGFIPDLLDVILKDFNVTYEISLVPDGKFGSQEPTGIWNGLVGELVKGNADIAAAPITVTPERTRVVKFGFPFMPANIVPLVKKPENPGDKLLFRHIKDLVPFAQAGNLTLGILKGGATEAMFKESTYNLYHDIYRHMMQKEREGVKVLVNSYNEGVEKVRTLENFVFLGDEWLFDYASGKAPCDVMVWGKPLNTAFYALAFPSNVPQRYIDLLNQRLVRLQRFGRLRRLKDKWWHSDCQKPKLCLCNGDGLKKCDAIQGARH